MTTSTSLIDERYQVEVSNSFPGQQVSPKARGIWLRVGRLTKAKGPQANIENVGKSWEDPYFPSVSLGKSPRNKEKDVHEGSQDREGERDVEENMAGILSKVLRRQGHELLSSRDLSHDGISEVPVLGASLEWIVPSGLDFSVLFFFFAFFLVKMRTRQPQHRRRGDHRQKEVCAGSLETNHLECADVACLSGDVECCRAK